MMTAGYFTARLYEAAELHNLFTRTLFTEGLERCCAMRWLPDHEKDGERYTNSECLAWCVKCFRDRKRVEAWRLGKGYHLQFATEAEAIFTYQVIKGIESEGELAAFLYLHSNRVEQRPRQ